MKRVWIEMDKREEAIHNLKNMIRDQRNRMDPKLLKMAETAVAKALLQNKIDSHAGVAEPYDKENANKAIESFLENHTDAKGFKERLFAFLKKNQH